MTGRLKKNMIKENDQKSTDKPKPFQFHILRCDTCEGDEHLFQAINALLEEVEEDQSKT